MNRRTFLGTATATTATIALAGCSGSDEDYQEGSSGDSGDGDEEGNGLELVTHDMVVEEGEFTTDIFIEGRVRNVSDDRKDYAEVTARVYDSSGAQLDSYFTNTTDLDAGAEWAFEITVLEDAEDVDDYDIAVSDSSF